MQRVSPGNLFLAFLKLGVLGFGGPYALLALMEKELVNRRGWLTPEEFAESTAIGTLTPGPIFFAAAVHAGYRLKGLGGALIAASASLLPGFILAVTIAAFYLRFQLNPVVISATTGFGAAVIGLLVVATMRLGKTLLRDFRAAILAVLAFVMLTVFKLNTVIVILCAGVLGLLLYIPSRKIDPDRLPKDGAQ